MKVCFCSTSIPCFLSSPTLGCNPDFLGEHSLTVACCKPYILGKAYLVTDLPKFSFLSSMLLLSYWGFMWWEMGSVSASCTGSFPISARLMLICGLFLGTCAHREHASAQTFSLTDLQCSQYPPVPKTLPFVTCCYPQGTVGDLLDINKLLQGVSSPTLAILQVGTI